MLRNSIFFGLTLGLSVAAFGCGGSDDDNNAATNPEPTEQPCDCGQPPEDPEGPAGDGDGVVLAVNKLFLGDTDRNGTADPDAWKSIGYNLDNYKSTASSKNVCKPRAGAQPSIHVDGNDGIDNAFGKGILPAIALLADNPTATVNDEIADGSFTLMLKLDEVGTGDNYSGIKASLYAGGNLEAEPKWDGTDEWPVMPELLNGGDINSPKIVFTDSYVADRTWVGKADKLDISIAIQDVSLTLTINHAVITMDLESGNSGAKNGTIAGILEVDQLLETISKAAPAIGGCDFDISQFQSVLDSLAQAADILADGTQDPSKTCNGISIGLGFEAKPVQLGVVLEPSEGGGEEC